MHGATMTTTEHITTAEQLLRASDLGRCELVRGELIMMAPAGFEHGEIGMHIGTILRSFVTPRKLGVVVGADTGFQIARNPDTVRAPDAAFVRADRVAGKRPRAFFQGAPDLAVEVVSPGDRAREVLAKVHEWLDAGCRVVWVVDPRTRSIAVHQSRAEVAVLRSSETLSGGDLLPGLTVPVGEIFTP